MLLLHRSEGLFLPTCLTEDAGLNCCCWPFPVRFYFGSDYVNDANSHPVTFMAISLISNTLHPVESGIPGGVEGGKKKIPTKLKMCNEDNTLHSDHSFWRTGLKLSLFLWWWCRKAKTDFLRYFWYHNSVLQLCQQNPPSKPWNQYSLTFRRGRKEFSGEKNLTLILDWTMLGRFSLEGYRFLFFINSPLCYLEKSIRPKSDRVC